MQFRVKILGLTLLIAVMAMSGVGCSKRFSKNYKTQNVDIIYADTAAIEELPVVDYHSTTTDQSLPSVHSANESTTTTTKVEKTNVEYSSDDGELPVFITSNLESAREETVKATPTDEHASNEKPIDGVLYTVKRGDTLMKIAHENLGTVFGWRKIFSMNKEALEGPNQIQAGTQIYLPKVKPQNAVTGNMQKYIVKPGESLASIAASLYGDEAQWKKLWKLNKPFLNNPNQIFADFYIFYEADATSRNTASSKKTVN